MSLLSNDYLKLILFGCGCIIGVFATLPALACIAAPEDLTVHHRDLVAGTDNIVLAKVVRATDEVGNGWSGKRPFAIFETVEIMKGSAPERFSLPTGFIANKEEPGFGDFNNHRDLAFWDKQITRNWNTPSCTMEPLFYVGRTYLIFLDHPHWRAYEEIRSGDDLWLQAVRTLIKDPTLSAGLSLTVDQWLKLADSVFVGEIQSCSGPTLRVKETFYGTIRESWKYSSQGDLASYWPLGACEIGEEIFVITYFDKPWPLPYYSASVHRIHEQKIDLSRTIRASEIDINGKQVLEIFEIRNMLGTEGR